MFSKQSITIHSNKSEDTENITVYIEVQWKQHQARIPLQLHELQIFQNTWIENGRMLWPFWTVVTPHLPSQAVMDLPIVHFLS